MIVIFVALIISVIFILYHYKNDLKQFYTLVKFSKTVPGPSYFELGKQSSESINSSESKIKIVKFIRKKTFNSF